MVFKCQGETVKDIGKLLNFVIYKTDKPFLKCVSPFKLPLQFKVSQRILNSMVIKWTSNCLAICCYIRSKSLNLYPQRTNSPTWYEEAGPSVNWARCRRASPEQNCLEQKITNRTYSSILPPWKTVITLKKNLKHVTYYRTWFLLRCFFTSLCQ